MSLLHTLRFITAHPLNQTRRLAALGRFAKWQLGSRLVPGAVLCEWINDARFLARHGETGLTGNIYVGLHEFADMGFMLHFLRPDDLFIDVGANMGSYTILACAAVGAKVVAFEPVPKTHARLVENVRLNAADGRVLAINKGVGATSDHVAFTNGQGTANHALATNESRAAAIDVEVTTLDQALLGQSPSLMKMDVEGYEAAALQGARQVLANPELRGVIMELNGSGNRYGYDESEILTTMLALGFETFTYDPLGRKLVELGGKNLHSGNTLFLRDRTFVETRLRDAPKVRVSGIEF